MIIITQHKLALYPLQDASQAFMVIHGKLNCIILRCRNIGWIQVKYIFWSVIFLNNFFKIQAFDLNFLQSYIDQFTPFYKWQSLAAHNSVRFDLISPGISIAGEGLDPMNCNVHSPFNF